MEDYECWLPAPPDNKKRRVDDDDDAVEGGANSYSSEALSLGNLENSGRISNHDSSNNDSISPTVRGESRLTTAVVFDTTYTKAASFCSPILERCHR
jgi:hypothetical protein